MPKPLHVHPKLRKGYGWKPGLPSQHFPMYSARVEAAALPAKVDLRPHCPGVYDQGQLGSCTGNAWSDVITKSCCHTMPLICRLGPMRIATSIGAAAAT